MELSSIEKSSYICNKLPQLKRAWNWQEIEDLKQIFIRGCLFVKGKAQIEKMALEKQEQIFKSKQMYEKIVIQKCMNDYKKI